MATFEDWLHLGYDVKHAVAEKFVAADEAVASDGGDPQLSEDARLALWALQQQRTHGDNAEEKPSMWEFTASAKWSAWDAVRGLSEMDAMRKFIGILDEDLGPRWPIEHAAAFVAAAAAVEESGQEPHGGEERAEEGEGAPAGATAEPIAASAVVASQV